MKHLNPISRPPAKAVTQELTIGQIIALVAQILSVIGTALTAKNSTA